jgi:Methyltransferase domain
MKPFLGLGTLRKLFLKANMPLDVLNTILPEQDAQLKTRLKEVCKIPRMATFGVGAMINVAVSNLKPDEVFLNIGVWNGFTFLSGVVHNPDKICIGVDNFSEFGGPREAFLARFTKFKSKNHFFYDMDYEEYFRNIHQAKIGLYLYDGGHKYEDQLKGLQLAEPYFSDNCIIMVDDTNWPDPSQATYDFIKQSKNHYEVLLDVKTAGNSHLTYHNGVILLQKAS